jgi:hypothetical protein
VGWSKGKGERRCEKEKYFLLAVSGRITQYLRSVRNANRRRVYSLLERIFLERGRRSSYIVSTYVDKKSRDSSVSIALGYGLDDRGSRVRFPAWAGNFFLHHRVQNGSGAHPASYPMDTRDHSLGVNRPVREADHSLPSSAEVKE